MMHLISITEAAEQGIDRVRKPIWAAKEDHLKIDILDGKPGPWLHLWSPLNQMMNGRDPVDVLIFQCDQHEKVYELYGGPLPDSKEYKAAVRRTND